MKIDNTINQAIDRILIERDDKRNSKHKSSGRLSASTLGWPLQWQVLKYLKVDSVPKDTYTLRKFLRGTQIEDWLVTMIPDVADTQVFCEYRDTVGYVDVLTKDMPHEVKSTTNAKYKWITKLNKPDESHALQGAFYAIARGYQNFAIDYVASDDLRVITFVMDVRHYKKKIDDIIDTYQKQIEKKEVPVFVPFFDWQTNIKYNDYPEWSQLNADDIKDKCNRLDIRFP